MRDGKQHVILCKRCEIEIISCTHSAGNTADTEICGF